MIRTLLLLAFALALAAPARAQTGTHSLPLVPVGYCQLTPAVATKLSTCPIPAGSSVAVLRTSGASIRYRDDGIAPTALIGQPVLTTDPPLVYVGTLSALQIIQQAPTATVGVAFYRSP
jgi:hypothetical protein